MTEQLGHIAKQMENLLSQFIHPQRGYPYLRPEYSAKFKVLAIEAKAVIDRELGHLNDFSIALVSPASGSSSEHDVHAASGVVLAAAREIENRRVRPPALPALSENTYVDPSRIVALKSIQSANFDFSRLAELCRELNIAAAHNCHLSTAMLLRAILDHVPPLMGQKSFAEVANNYGGERSTSFKKSMARLQGALRDIADMHLHQAIRQKEDLPTWNQVDFKAELDVLLGEIVRLDGVPPSTAKA